MDFIPPSILRLRETLCTRFYFFSVLPEIRTDKNPYYQESPFYIHLFWVFPCGLLAVCNCVAPRPLLLSIVTRCRFNRRALPPHGLRCFNKLRVFAFNRRLLVFNPCAFNSPPLFSWCKGTNNILNKSSWYKKYYVFNLFPYKNTYFNGIK